MNQKSVYDLAIIGAGIIGSTLARLLSRYELSICLIEKENDVSCGTKGKLWHYPCWL